MILNNFLFHLVAPIHQCSLSAYVEIGNKQMAKVSFGEILFVKNVFPLHKVRGITIGHTFQIYIFVKTIPKWLIFNNCFY